MIGCMEIIDFMITPKGTTFTSDSIPRISRMTRAVERSFRVGTVGISVTVVCSRCAFVDV